MGVAEIVIQEGAGDELELVPLDECGDFCREVLAEEGGGVGWVREAFFEELVVWLVEVLVGHGSARMIGWWDAAASGNAATTCFEVWPHLGLMCLARFC